MQKGEKLSTPSTSVRRYDTCQQGQQRRLKEETKRQSETEKQLDVIAHRRLHLGEITHKEKNTNMDLCVISFIAALSRVIHYERHEIN